MSSTGTVSSKDSVVANIQSAVSIGKISSSVGQSIIENLDASAIAGCSGVDPSEVDSEEITLVAVVIDASGSMYSYRDSVIDSYNKAFLESLRKARNADSIHVSTWVFSDKIPGNTKLIHSYLPLSQCPELTKQDYKPDGGTPLYQAVNAALTGIFDYGNTLMDSGTNVKRIVVVLSDGEHNTPGGVSKVALQEFSANLLNQENCVLSYIFFGDAVQGDHMSAEIGFPPHHRLTANLSGQEIRRVFGTVSASVISKSQTAVSSASLSSNGFFDMSVNFPGTAP